MISIYHKYKRKYCVSYMSSIAFYINLYCRYFSGSALSSVFCPSVTSPMSDAPVALVIFT